MQEEKSQLLKADSKPSAEPAAGRPKAAAKAAKGAAKASNVSPLEQLANAASWQAESERVQRAKASRKAAAAAVKQVLLLWNLLQLHILVLWSKVEWGAVNRRYQMPASGVAVLAPTDGL